MDAIRYIFNHCLAVGRRIDLSLRFLVGKAELKGNLGTLGICWGLNEVNIYQVSSTVPAS